MYSFVTTTPGDTVACFSFWATGFVAEDVGRLTATKTAEEVPLFFIETTSTVGSPDLSGATLYISRSSKCRSEGIKSSS
jgi:hypothetical protein